MTTKFRKTPAHIFFRISQEKVYIYAEFSQCTQYSPMSAPGGAGKRAKNCGDADGARGKGGAFNGGGIIGLNTSTAVNNKNHPGFVNKSQSITKS